MAAAGGGMDIVAKLVAPSERVHIRIDKPITKMQLDASLVGVSIAQPVPTITDGFAASNAAAGYDAEYRFGLTGNYMLSLSCTDATGPCSLRDTSKGSMTLLRVTQADPVEVLFAMTRDAAGAWSAFDLIRPGRFEDEAPVLAPPSPPMPPNTPPPGGPPPMPPPLPPYQPAFVRGEYAFATGTLPQEWTNHDADSLPGQADVAWSWKGFGGTPSSGTGPSGGPAAGKGYYFTEASNGNSNKNFIMEYTGCDTSLVSQVTMQYHMKGVNMGSLSILDQRGGIKWLAEGPQGDQWLTATATVRSPTFKIKGTTGGGWASDMAFADVRVECYPATISPSAAAAESAAALPAAAAAARPAAGGHRV